MAYNNHYYQQHYSQEQSMLDKQKVEQKIDAEFNIDFMGRALSKAEIYAFRFGDPTKIKDFEPLFGYYNRFNSGYEKDQMELFKSLVNAVKMVDYGLEETEYKFGEILFPNNMSKEEVINYIKLLSSFLNHPQEISIYEDLINVLKRDEKDYKKYKHLYDKNNAKMDPKEMMDAYPHINKAFGRKEKNWKENIENNPDYQPGFKFGQDFKDDKDFEDYAKRGKKNFK